ncbi:MAG: hypothetical protein LAO19_16320 [Acidobacteriia bacterium]|nr:hypothetical protein [Terriglobia bacterium]
MDTREIAPARSTPAHFRLRAAGISILAAMLVAPIWMVRFPPLLDYPNHLARSFVLAHLHDPAFTFGNFYRADWGAYPYLGMDASLAILRELFPMETAGRVFLSLCVLALPAAAWFFLRQVNMGGDASAAWALLIAFNVFFLEGFLNFDLSLAVGFFALGLWLRWLQKPEYGRWLFALIAFTALYFTHLIGFALSGLIVIAALALSRRTLRDWIWSGGLAIPGFAFYLHSSRAGMSANKIIFHGLGDKLDSLQMFLHGYSPALDWISLTALGAWFLAAWWRNPEFRWNGRWLSIAAFLFALFWLIPWMWADGSDLDIRVFPFLFVAILASARAGKRAKRLVAIPFLLFAARTVDTARHFAAAQPELASLAQSFEAVPRGALVLPIVEGDQDPIERPFTHFWGYGVIRRGWFSPYLMDIAGETPMRIVHDSYTPDGFWDHVYDEPPDWKLVQDDYDYVWAYGVPRFSAPLAEIGEKIYSHGPLEVYRLRKIPSGKQ